MMAREEWAEILNDLASFPLEERQRIAREFREKVLAYEAFQKDKNKKIALQICDAMDRHLA